MPDRDRTAPVFQPEMRSKVPVRLGKWLHGLARGSRSGPPSCPEKPRGRAFAEIRLRPPVENDRRSAKPATVPVPALSRAGRAGGGRRPSCASRRYRAGSSEIPRPRCRGVSDVLALPSWVAKKIPSSFPHATDPPVRRRRSSSVVVRRASKSMHYLPAPGWDPMSLHRDGWWVSESSTPTVNSPHASWIRVALGRLDGGTLCRGRERSIRWIGFRFDFYSSLFRVKKCLS